VRRLAASSALVSALALGVTACSNGGNSASSGKPTTSTPTSPPATTATTLDPKAAAQAAVLRDYRAFWDAYHEAAGVTGLPVNPDAPALPAHMTGEQLTHMKVYLVGLRGKGYRNRQDSPSENHPRVVALTASTATVDDCEIDGTHVVDAKTGELHDSPGPGRLGWEADMVLQRGTWKVSFLHTRSDLCGGS
jgi:hypothetical protein